MFHSARIKLTAWYLLIIMSVSLSFSAVIYRLISNEVERFARMQRSRIERRFGIDFFVPGIPSADLELMQDIRNRLFLRLAIINGSIFLAAGGLGYVLAGRTLRPIAEMVDEQNRFISDASHELRTPLTSLKSTIEVNLRDPHLSLSESKKILRDSVGDVDRLNLLTDELLQLSRYQGAGSRLKYTRVSLNDTVASAVRKIGPQAKQKRIAVAVSGDDPVTAWGNADSLTELFVILLDNAVKYSGTDTRIETELRRGKGTAVITVKDEGAGIGKKDLPHIFDRFYRADRARSGGETSGYGLGLSIARKIGDEHRGIITVTSTPGKGSVFTVNLPAKA